MENIRCVIANMPRQILGDIVENMVQQSGDIEVIRRVDNVSQVKSELARDSVDLLILGLKTTDLPEACIGILNDVPNIAIVGLVEDGRRLAAFLDNVGKNDIVKIIRALCRKGDEAQT